MKSLGSVKKSILNGIYFLVVFSVAFVIATQALSRRVNSYEATQTPLFFSVEKERVVLSNSVTGRVDSIEVLTGQHVREGDLLVRLVDDSLAERVETLESLSEENLSARTELALLKAKESSYEIRAPRDGVVYEVQAAEGSYLSTNSPVVILFADDNVKIFGTVNRAQYADIQSDKDVDVYNSRFEQVYKISFEGVGRVQSSTGLEERYEINFRFSDSNDGAAFIDGEGLEVISKNTDGEATRPSERVRDLWNKLILGS
ncbi:MAG: HlyD family efflux transporter periplasmic adaptor subunit [Candidatus Moranbacteria bacterium]|nr:HlyD family efflux transporter periplasmic adaptor subunit [Candidatus Moranbacteria bacterium]